MKPRPLLCLLAMLVAICGCATADSKQDREMQTAADVQYIVLPIFFCLRLRTVRLAEGTFCRHRIPRITPSGGGNRFQLKCEYCLNAFALDRWV
jgi:hypothetical protein